MPRSVTALVSRDSRVSRTFARLPRLFHNTEIDRYVARCSANITHHPGRTAETRDKAIQDWRDSRGVKARA